MKWSATAAGLTLTVLGLAACGGSGSPTQTASARATRGIAFSQCMRRSGVPNFPDPTSGSGGLQVQASQRAGSGRSLTIDGVPVSSPAFQAAMHKCQSRLPHGPPPTPAELAKLRSGALAMARCMRAHGVTNFPDPVVSAGPGGHGIGIRTAVLGTGGLDPGSPALQSATKACMPLLRGALGKGRALAVQKAP